MSVLTSDSWLRTVSSVLTPHLPGEQSSLPSNLSLLSQFLNVSLSSELDPISLPDSTGLVIGEGTTYQVEKATIRKDTEFVAVKRTKFRFPKTRNQVLIGAGAEELYSRLRSVLLEIKTLSHPPLKNHPNIARLLGYSWDENVTGYAPVLVVEFAQFGDARAFFGRVRDLSWEEKRLFCADIADGLDAVHSSMIVHGDVKLENVLVFTNPAAERRFTAKLSDFEHALLDDVVPRYGGTRIYNAPEVHRQDTDPIPVVELQLCDVFSFGLLVFEAFCDGRQYVDFKECEPFRLALSSSAAAERRDILELALAFLKEVTLFPHTIMGICREVFRHTLLSIPNQRLSGGWQTITAILAGVESVSTDRTVEPSFSTPVREAVTSFSILPFVTHVSPRSEDIPDQMGAQLEFIAKSAVTKQEQGKAAFELSICHATRYVSFANPDDALKWLEHSASCGHIDAFIAGKRVFQANKVAIPPSLTIIPDYPGLEDDLIFLDSLTSEEYFSNAVRIFWTKDLRNSALRSLHSKLEVLEMFLERIREMSNTMTSNDFIAIVDKDLLLHRAVVLGSTDATKFLLAHGAAINNARFEGRTPLHIACRCAHLDLIRLLLSHSADASTNDHGNISPIHWLVLLPASEMSDIAQLLIQNGANINSKTRKVSAEVFDCLGLVLHDTPLLWACCCRNSAAVTTLLACGAVGKQFQLEAALSIAAADIVDTLLSKVEDFQTFSEEQAEELFTEVGGGFFRGFQRWIVHGETYEEAHSAVMDTLSRHRIILPNPSNASLTGGRRLSPLCRATVSLNLPLAKQLIKRGADINERLSDIRWTPLHWALKACITSQLPAPTLVVSMVEFLLQNGAALDLDEGLPAGHPYHRTRATNPLSYACEERVPAEVIKLIASWAPEKLHEKERGETPLHRLAAISEDTEAVFALVGLGADLNVETNHRPEWGEMTCCHTPLAHAISDGVWEIAELFLDREASTEIGLSGGHRSTILHLLVERASHTVAYGYPRKLLELRLLLQNVLDHPIVQQRQLLEVEDYNGITPLGLAIQLGVPNYVEIFLGWGARAVFPAKGTSLPEFVTSLHEHPPQRVVDDTTKRRGGQRFISEYRDKLAQILSIVKAHIAV